MVPLATLDIFGAGDQVVNRQSRKKFGTEREQGSLARFARSFPGWNAVINKPGEIRRRIGLTRIVKGLAIGRGDFQSVANEAAMFLHVTGDWGDKDVLSLLHWVIAPVRLIARIGFT